MRHNNLCYNNSQIENAMEINNSIRLPRIKFCTITLKKKHLRNDSAYSINTNGYANIIFVTIGFDTSK